MKVHVSGVHSGPDPSSGVGVARSLKAAFLDATVVGVDYSSTSSGIHYEAFDHVWVQRPWSELDLDLYREQIARELAGGAAWISCLDLEAQWLATVFPGEPNLLVPPECALHQIMKPAIPAARYLPASIPEYTIADRSDWELYAFCRRKGWPVWCKGPNHEARLAWVWPDVARALADLRRKWPAGQPALQANVRGNEESVVFCAHRGRLLDCVRMTKRAQTVEGKTWAGTIDDVPADMRGSLEQTVRRLGWTGGGELEFVRDDSGALHLIDWNPRFPAWVYGATLAGRNLPARLVEGAGLGRAREAVCVSTEFSRVVLEVPVRSGYPLPPPPSTGQPAPVQGKHPSGMVLLSRRLGAERPGGEAASASVPSATMHDLSDASLWDLSTPRRIFLPATATEVFRRARAVLEAGQQPGVRLAIAYSVKTNPHRQLMTLARENGFLAETITASEFRHAIDCGFAPGQIVLNGPAQGWPQGQMAEAPMVAFADSLERLEDLLDAGLKSKFLGIRLRPPTSYSRFGADLADPAAFSALVELLSRLDGPSLGVHFHIQSDVIGIKPWQDIYRSMLHWARALQEKCNRPVRCVDTGGGWFPEDFGDELAPRLPGLLEEAVSLLPGLECFLLEPGKALAQPCMAVVTRVLEVRRPRGTKGRAEVVVDGSVADLPMAPYFPHRAVTLRRDGEMAALPGGEGRVLGRNCMEYDILATGTGIPAGLSVGDLLVFCDAGGYDSSMAYQFGAGRMRDD